MMYHLHGKYGTICRVPAMFGKPPMVFTFDPVLSQQIYRTEGTWPSRRSIETYDYYRKNVRPEVFKDGGGLVSDQGEPWYNLRTKVNPVMMQPRTVKSYIDPVDAVTREFVAKIATMRDHNDETPAHFDTDIGAWALESIGVIALDRRLGAMDANRQPEVEQLIQVKSRGR